MAQAGSDDDKTGGRKSRWTVPLILDEFNYLTYHSFSNYLFQFFTFLKNIHYHVVDFLF